MGIQIENRVGPAIEVQGGSLSAVSRAVVLKWPGSGGGLIWNRPQSVIFTTPDGEDHVMPVPDATRAAQLVMLAIGLLVSFLVWLAYKK